MIEKFTGHRSKQRTYIYTGVVVWLLVINIWLFHTYYSRNSDSRYLTKSSIYDAYDPSNQQVQQQQQKLLENPSSKSFKEDITIKLLQKQQSKEKDIRNIDAHASIYNKIFENHEIDSIFGNLNFQQRCDLFFQNLFINDKNWIFKVNEKIELENKHEFKFNDWRNNHLEDYKKNFAEKNNKNKDEVEHTAEFETFIRKGYEDFWNRTMTYEQNIVDHISILRVFNKCYLTSDNTTQIKRTQEFINKQQKLIHGVNIASKSGKGVPPFSYTKQENLINFKSIKHSAFEHRVYPWLSFEYPIYERFTGELFYKPPQMSKFVKGDSQKTSKSYKESEQMDFFLNRFKNKCNGKGIVLSIGNDHVDDTVRLIHLLRALNNKLPIQIVYYDDISDETKKKIVTAGREVIVTLPKSFDKIAHYFPEDYRHNEKGLPEQEIWFVNTYNVIHSDYKDKFKKFANKFLATFFNSFEEIMLIDADTVMMQTPEYFFNLLGYKESGTYFYKDRTTFETRPMSDSVFFKKIGPSIVDSVMFDIPIMTKYTIDTDFFKGLFHYQESGLVMLNRKIHFNALLMMFQLNFYEPVTKRSHGDKELFWLAMAIAGEENYVFDENHAAAIGIKTTPQDRPRPDGHTPHESIELCSPHPGHVSSSDNALVWINSGFFYCSKSPELDFAKEAEQKDRLKDLHTADQFRAFYTSPLRIKSAIIPPKDLNHWGVNNEDEPSRGWFMDSRYCKGYMWCAYSSTGGKTKTGENNKREGRVIDFSLREQEMFEYYGDVWVGLE